MLSWSVLGYPGVSWGNQTDRLCLLELLCKIQLKRRYSPETPYSINGLIQKDNDGQVHWSKKGYSELQWNTFHYFCNYSTSAVCEYVGFIELLKILCFIIYKFWYTLYTLRE